MKNDLKAIAEYIVAIQRDLRSIPCCRCKITLEHWPFTENERYGYYRCPKCGLVVIYDAAHDVEVKGTFINRMRSFYHYVFGGGNWSEKDKYIRPEMPPTDPRYTFDLDGHKVEPVSVEDASSQLIDPWCPGLHVGDVSEH